MRDRGADPATVVFARVRHGIADSGANSQGEQRRVRDFPDLKSAAGTP